MPTTTLSKLSFLITADARGLQREAQNVQHHIGGIANAVAAIPGEAGKALGTITDLAGGISMLPVAPLAGISTAIAAVVGLLDDSARASARLAENQRRVAEETARATEEARRLEARHERLTRTSSAVRDALLLMGRPAHEAVAAASGDMGIPAWFGDLGGTEMLAGTVARIGSIGRTLEDELAELHGLGLPEWLTDALRTEAATRSLNQYTRALEFQQQTIGMTAGEIRILEAARDGASAAALIEAEAVVTATERLQEENRAREEAIRLTADMAAAQARQAQHDVAALWEATRTPLERYNAEMERLTQLLVMSGQIPWWQNMFQGAMMFDLLARGAHRAGEELRRAQNAGGGAHAGGARAGGSPALVAGSREELRARDVAGRQALAEAEGRQGVGPEGAGGAGPRDIKGVLEQIRNQNHRDADRIVHAIEGQGREVVG